MNRDSTPADAERAANAFRAVALTWMARNQVRHTRMEALRSVQAIWRRWRLHSVPCPPADVPQAVRVSPSKRSIDTTSLARLQLSARPALELQPARPPPNPRPPAARAQVAVRFAAALGALEVIYLGVLWQVTGDLSAPLVAAIRWALVLARRPAARPAGWHLAVVVWRRGEVPADAMPARGRRPALLAAWAAALPHRRWLQRCRLLAGVTAVGVSTNQQPIAPAPCCLQRCRRGLCPHPPPVCSRQVMTAHTPADPAWARPTAGWPAWHVRRCHAQHVRCALLGTQPAFPCILTQHCTYATLPLYAHVAPYSSKFTVEIQPAPFPPRSCRPNFWSAAGTLSPPSLPALPSFPSEPVRPPLPLPCALCTCRLAAPGSCSLPQHLLVYTWRSGLSCLTGTCPRPPVSQGC